MPANYYQGPTSSGGFAVMPQVSQAGNVALGDTLGKLVGAGADLALYDPANDPKAQQAGYYKAETGKINDGLDQQRIVRSLAQTHGAALRAAAATGDPKAYNSAVQDLQFDALNQGVSDTKTLADVIGQTSGTLPGVGDTQATNQYAWAFGKPLTKEESVTAGRQDQFLQNDRDQQTKITGMNNSTSLATNAATNATTLAVGAASNASAERRTAAEVAGRGAVEDAKIAGDAAKPLILSQGSGAWGRDGGLIAYQPDHGARLKDQTQLAQDLPGVIAGLMPGGTTVTNGVTQISDDPQVQNVIQAAAPRAAAYVGQGESVSVAAVKALNDVAEQKSSTHSILGVNLTTPRTALQLRTDQPTPLPSVSPAAPAAAPTGLPSTIAATLRPAPAPPAVQLTPSVTAPPTAPAPSAAPALPPALQNMPGLTYSPSRQLYRDSQGRVYDAAGNPVSR